MRRRGPLLGGDRLGLGACGLWGGHTSPSPTDRSKAGCKRHLITDAEGIPLLIETTPVNVRDEQPAESMLDNLPAVKKPRGRPRWKPVSLVGDAGYGFPALIAAVASRRIVPLLAERGRRLDGSGLGWFRCVAERSLAWFRHFRQLKLCYERSGDHFQGFHDLAAAFCARQLGRLLW